MATIKSYTDLPQSRKLAEILPLESADMYWFREIDSDYFPPDVESIYPIPLYKDSKEDFNYDIPCWSLAALLDVLPYGYSFILTKSFNGEDYYCKLDGEPIETTADNPINVCVKMIEKLHKLKML